MPSGHHRSVASAEARALAGWHRAEARQLIEAMAQLAPYVQHLPRRRPARDARQEVTR